MTERGISDIYALYNELGKICIDSRLDMKGSIFFALRGEKYDANQFVRQALDNGAEYCIVDDKKAVLNSKCIWVNDSIQTLQDLAQHHRRNLKIPVLAITGSNGKTTTKELLTAVLSEKYNCFSTPGNLNNHIGLPLSILKINKNHQIAVLELGANHRGENELLTSVCLPDYGITTNIGKDHLGEFGGEQGVVLAYKEFTDYFMHNKGLTFYFNTDDIHLQNLIKSSENIISFGIVNKEADYTAARLKDSVFEAAIIKTPVKSFKIHSNLFGSFNLYNMLAASTIGDNFGVSDEKIREAIGNYIPRNNRSQVIYRGSNTIILDAYNANPSSMQPAILDFDALQAASKVIILGDMFELGEYARDEHGKIIEMLAKCSFNDIVLVGQEFGYFRNGNFVFFESVAELKEWLCKKSFEDTTFYVKGSRAMKLEEAFEI